MAGKKMNQVEYLKFWIEDEKNKLPGRINRNYTHGLIHGVVLALKYFSNDDALRQELENIYKEWFEDFLERRY